MTTGRKLVDYTSYPRCAVLSDFRWFAVHCHPGMETVVDFTLRTMLIETLLPMAKQAVRHSRHTARLLVRPLFAGYLFANFCVANSLRTVALSRGVLHVVSAKGKPVPVSDAIIASLRERVGPDGLVELCGCPRLDRPQVAPGPLQYWPTIFEERLSDERRIEILLQTLQESLGTFCDSHKEPNAVQLQTAALS
jgi:transcription antitermination factor NusG